MTVQEWLGEDNSLGIDIFNKKYRYNEESFDEWLDRVSGGNKDIRKLIEEQKFLFGGRILANRGLDKLGKKVTLSNCYVLPQPEDNIESIFECAKQMARTYSYGGGVGIDVSKLAPRGAKINNTAEETSGAVSFMDLYDLTTKLIGQKGRRGALMISISCEHPDLLEFIELKLDLNKINKANISVRITDEFMKAVSKNKKFMLEFKREETGTIIRKEIDAREMFDKLCESNWRVGEAGVLFWDRISSWHLMSEDEDFEYAGVNPCLHPDSMIETVEGRIRIADIKEPIGVYTMLSDGSLGIKTASASWISKKDAQTINITTKNGKTIRVTPDHKIMTHDGWVEAKDLKIGDRIVQLLRRRRGVAYSGVRLTSQKNGSDIMEHRLVASYSTTITKNDDVHHIDGDTYNNAISNLQVLSHSEHSTLTRYDSKNNHQIHGENGDFICGNGDYQKTIIPMPIELQSYMINQHSNTIVSIELGDITDVYDLTVDETHNFIADYMVVHNCAEESLPSGGSCLLGSINLSKFVTKHKLFDFDGFSSAVRTSVIALNEVLDEGLPLHPLQIQRDSVRDYRQIGLGIFGLADLLIKLELKYGSEDSLKLCDTIGKVMIDTAIYQSSMLAKESGAFEKYKFDKISNSKFFRQNTSKSTVRNVATYGLRNSQILTIAPTGTLSTMLGVSGGIEPIFSNSYTRKTESLHGEDVYYKVFTPIVKEYLDSISSENEEDLPDYFITAQNLNYIDRINMQSVWQKHIDASISSTINVPNDFPLKEVYDVYVYAWKKGLKGLTMFRDGCERTGILSTSEQKVDSPKTEEKPEWGTVISANNNPIGRKRKLVTGCGSLYLLAFFDKSNGKLLETYLTKGSSGTCQCNLTAESRLISTCTRAGVSIDKIIDQLNSSGVCPSYAVRTATKHDTSKGSSCPIAIAYALKEMQEEVFEELKTGLKKEVEEIKELEIVIEETIISNKNLCPECGEPIIHEGNCISCRSCGWSKCS